MTLRWDVRVKKVQEALRAVGLYAGELDGRPGNLTADGVLDAWRRRLPEFDPDTDMMKAFRAAVAAQCPTQKQVLAEVSPHLRPNPQNPKRGLWADGGAYARKNYRRFDLPIAGSLYMHEDAAWRWKLALGEVAYKHPGLSLGKTASFCIRCMNWIVGAAWSIHCWGAIDFDLNKNKVWERNERNLPPEVQDALCIMRSWGTELGVDWHGKSRDDMHGQVCTV